MTPRDQAADAFLLRLYRGSTEIPFARFQDWALGQLGELVRFDAAWWGKANREPSRILSVHLLGADPGILDDYRRIDGVDFFRDAMLASPGTTVNLADLVSRKAFERSAVYTRYGRKHRVEAAVGTVLVEPVSSMLDFLTIWRFDPRWPFAEIDRQTVERVMPHLIEANRICRLVSLRGRPEAEPPRPCDPVRPWALASAVDGCLLEVSATFIALARREWPDWTSAVLPAALLRQFDRAEPYVGAAIVVEIDAVDDYRLLAARPRHGFDRLGARESAVLERYASGLSYRAIAAELGTSPATVRNQIARIYRKLGVRDKIGLVRAIEAARSGRLASTQRAGTQRVGFSSREAGVAPPDTPSLPPVPSPPRTS